MNRTHSRNHFLIATLGLAALFGTSLYAGAQISLVGVGSIAGTATDLSGLTGVYTDPSNGDTIPQNLFGAFGSGIAYTGVGNRYIVVNDRGYANGTVDYKPRYHTVDINVAPVNPAATPITTHLLSTTLLTTENGTNFTGLSSAFDTANPASSLRLDPEAVRVSSDGKSLFISDEYGPYIYQIDRQTGKRIATLNVPAKFAIAHPDADGNAELANNTSGRQSNRGMEGLAISPDGKTLFGLMQNALIQDGALDGSLNRVGLNNRILKVDIATGKTQEFVYQLDNKGYGTNEILAVNDHQFLVIERDGKAGSKGVKRIYLIDIAGATDVSNITLPTGKTLPNGVKAASKTLFLDMQDSSFNYASFLGGAFTMPEKIEGLAFGPDFADGDHLLLITNDNDLIQSNANYFFAYKIGKNALPGFHPQVVVPEPSSIVVALMSMGSVGLLAARKRRASR